MNIESSIVKFQNGGQGVLVQGGLIVTAAHCIEYDGRGVLGLDFLEKIETYLGVTRMALAFFEPVSDVAILVARDAQACDPTADPYDDFIETATALTIATEFAPPKDHPVRIYTHDNGWVEGMACLSRDSRGALIVETHRVINSGASGGPVLNEAGELVGIVSTGAGTKAVPLICPNLMRVLPIWALEESRRKMRLTRHHPSA